MPIAVSCYIGIRKSLENTGIDIIDFVDNKFYVDDGLISCEAVNLMKQTQVALQNGSYLRLHKITSNGRDVSNQFRVDDLTNNIKDITFENTSNANKPWYGMGYKHGLFHVSRSIIHLTFH